MAKRPVRKPGFTHGCESCDFKGSEFSTDSADPDVIRVYCKARHVDVNAEVMAKDCDFFKIDPTFVRSKEDTNRYGL